MSRRLARGIISMFCIIGIVMPVLGCIGKPEIARCDELVYSYVQNETGGITLTAYTGSEADPYIPTEIDGKPVTEIGDGCFQGLLGIKKVHVPEGIVRIGEYAFECCALLEKIYFPETLASIGDGAFSGCVQLTLADMQDGIESIGDGAFLYCRSLVYIVLPQNLKELGDFAFANCSNLTRAVFRGDGINRIPDRAFYGCANLLNVDLPASITSVGKRAFAKCESLRTLYFAEFLDEVGRYAFDGCSSLAAIDIQAASIGERAFSGCRSLTYLRLGDRTRSIGYAAFMGSGITSLDIPGSVEDIAEGAFYSSTIASVQVGDGSAYQVANGSLYADGGKTLLVYFPEDPYAEAAQTQFTVPDGVEIIASYAFSRCSLTEVVLPGSLKEIRDFAFKETVVEKVDIPEGVSVGADAFASSPLEAQMVLLTQQKGSSEPAADTGSASPAVPERIGSYAGDKSLFDEQLYSGYLEIGNDEFDAWSERYLAFNSDPVPLSESVTPYIMLYKGEVVSHYVAMSAVQNRDPERLASAAEQFGDDFEAMYLMMNHGLSTELRRGRMCDDLVLYSGVYDSQIMAAAGTDSVPTLDELAGCVGREFTDPVMISTTTDIGIACNFSDTLFIIYASKEAMESLGAICIDSYAHTNENEILLCENAQYRLLDVGVMAIPAKDPSGNETVLYRDYIKLELLG